MRFAIPLVALCLSATFAQAQVTIKATNKLPIARANQTIEIAGKDLPVPAGPRQDFSFIHITDSLGKEVLAQAVDTDLDDYHKPDVVIFQADFAPNESKTFTATLGAKQIYTEEQFKAHGRFMKERFDDFAWENDRIAHRMYGKWLETWKGEPLTASGVDLWSKRTPKMVIDKWYMVDNYHADTGEGYDDYSSNISRGVGGTGIWTDNKLYVSRNFVESRRLADGPIRVLFELVYEPFDAGNGVMVSEVKHIWLDAGSNLDHFQSTFKIASGQPAGPLTVAVGIKKVRGEEKDFDSARGILSSWEKMEHDSMQGVAVIVDPKSLAGQQTDYSYPGGRYSDWILPIKPDANNSVSYLAGFCWDKGGQFTDFAGWKKYLEESAQGHASPIEIGVGK